MNMYANTLEIVRCCYFHIHHIETDEEEGVQRTSVTNAWLL